MPTITTKDGIEIFYKDWGSGQPIVFSHGWPLSADDWDAQMLFFMDKGFRVIAHDRRGHGRSTQTGGGHDMDHYADDLAALTEKLDLRDAIHVGHSTGGGEVARYLGRHGEKRVAKAALISAVPPLMVKTPANPFNDGHKISRHEKELAHRRDIHHLGVDGDQHGSCGVQGPHRQVAKLRWAVDDYDIEIIPHLINRRGHAAKEQFVPPRLSLDHSPRRVVLELHQLEVSWYKAYPIEIRLAHHVPHWTTLVVIADRAVKRLVLRDIELRLIPEHRRE